MFGNLLISEDNCQRLACISLLNHAHILNNDLICFTFKINALNCLRLWLSKIYTYTFELTTATKKNQFLGPVFLANAGIDLKLKCNWKSI